MRRSQFQQISVTFSNSAPSPIAQRKQKKSFFSGRGTVWYVRSLSRKTAFGGSVPSPIAQGKQKNKKTHLGVWHSLVVRLVRDQEAAGSNPVTPTNIKNYGRSVLFNRTGADFLKISPRSALLWKKRKYA